MMELDLNTICNGHLKHEFLRYLPDLMSSCKETGKSSSITFKLTIEPKITVSDATGETHTTYAFRSKVRTAIPSLQGMELFDWENGEFVSRDTTMPLPFQSDDGN